MNGFDNRFSETLGRVQVYSTDHPELFEKGTPAGRVFEELRVTAEALTKHYLSQKVGKEDGKASTFERIAAREPVRQQVDSLSRTAHALNLADFWTPRERGDHGLIHVARIFADRAEPLAQRFVDGGMPPDFIGRLNTAVRRLEKAIGDQASRINTRLTATSEIVKTRNEALSLLDRLDSILENTLGFDSPLYRGWTSARRIERYGRAKRGAVVQDAQEVQKTQEAPAADKTDVQAA